MKVLFLCLATLFVAVIVAISAMEDPGYVLFAVGTWTVETTLALLAVVLIASFSLLYFLIRSGMKMVAVPRDLRQWKKQRRERKAIKLLTQGLIDLAEGRWQSAEKKVIKYAESSDASLLNYLAAARAAQAQGADQRRDNYLKLAHENHPAADIAVGLTQAELQLKQNQLEQCLATLRHLQQLAPKHAQVLKVLAGLYQRLEDWEHLLEIIPLLHKRKVMKADIIDDLAQQAYLALLRKAGSFTDLSNVWSRIPAPVREKETILMMYVQRLLALGESDLAEPLLRHALHRQFSDALLMCYGKIESVEPTRQLALVESMLTEHERDAVALLTAGRLSLRCKLWGKARSYLEASVNAKPTAEAYNELGNLLERMNETEAAAECFREGLRLVPGCEQTTPIIMEPATSPAIALTNQAMQEAEMRDVIVVTNAAKPITVEGTK
ncbi:MAG: tetratricopeptide repeat protein [Gammaproteobacteria bacterium]|nr:tetratricopeptide repeat protein [Gammaproteobacteria bacterium]